jgi:hypothetical protein
VAYGARLESVLGESPRGFESPILRHRTGYRASERGSRFVVESALSATEDVADPQIPELVAESAKLVADAGDLIPEAADDSVGPGGDPLDVDALRELSDVDTETRSVLEEGRGDGAQHRAARNRAEQAQSGPAARTREDAPHAAGALRLRPAGRPRKVAGR